MRTSYPPAGLEFGNAPSLKKHVPVPADPAETSVTRLFPEEQPWGWKTIDAMVMLNLEQCVVKNLETGFSV